VNGASNVTISNSNIGPCGGASGSTNTTDSNGIELTGDSENNHIYDNYIHPETKCVSGGAADQHDGIFDGSTAAAGHGNNIFQGNVVAYGGSDISVNALIYGDQVIGNFLLNPTAGLTGCGGEQGNPIVAHGFNMTVSNNYVLSCRLSGCG
jgi:hypothetical protein